MSLLPGVFQLKGVVQNYSWGGYAFLPDLLGITNTGQQPFAEYWLGAHPHHPSLLHREAPEALSQLIAAQPAAFLGASVAAEFATLPYLFKVLDVRQMLSIQVHPDKASAERGFEKEQEQGIGIALQQRNYKDRNHKPELMVALGGFWLLHGFKEETALRRVLRTVPELSWLRPVFDTGGYRGLYEEVMLMPQERVNEVLQPLLQRIVPQYQQGALRKDREDFWAARAALAFCKDGRYDRGIFSIYLFNLLYLAKGEGIYQPAGMPHAYLEGQNVEVMANSDNVLRAGLTDKHIAVAELMKHVRFEATRPQVIPAEENCAHQVFPSPAREFELHRYLLSAGENTRLAATTAEILLLTEGSMRLQSAGETLDLAAGSAVLATAGSELALAATADSRLFRVTVPQYTKN